MRAFYYIGVLLIGLLVLGCNFGSDKKSSNTPNKEQQINVMYGGQHNGCIKQYDELFCPKRYAKGILNAGEPEYVKDENGNLVILDGSSSDNTYVKITPVWKDRE
jgi:hypothetical protein